VTFKVGGRDACRWCGSMSSISTPTLKFLDLTVRKISHILFVCVSRTVTLTFDFFTLKLVRIPWGTVLPIGDTPTIRFRFMGHWANTAQTDHVTLWLWPLTLEVMAVCGWYGSSSSIRIPSLKFVGLAIRKIWRMMCVSITGLNGPGIWPFDLETGMRVASAPWWLGNLPSKFGHTRPLGSRIIRYVRDGQTDRQTDGQKQRLLVLPYGRGIISCLLIRVLYYSILCVMASNCF